MMTINPIKRSLIDSYNHHAQERDGYSIEPWKQQERANFLMLLQHEHKHSLLEIGAGAGKDGRFFLDNGLDVTCIDLSPGLVKLCLQKGLVAHVMDATDLKFEPDSFDAVYALNSFLHVSNAEIVTTLEVVKKVMRPSGLCSSVTPRAPHSTSPKSLFPAA